MRRFLELRCLRVGVLAVFALVAHAAVAGEGEIAAPHVVIKEPGRYIYHMVFSPDGTKLALSEVSSRLAEKDIEAVWDSMSGKKVWSRPLTFGTYHLWPVFSPDGKLLAMDENWKSHTAAPEGICLLDTETGKPAVVLKCGPRITEMGVAFSPDGKLLSIYGQASMTCVPQLWDVSTGKLAGSMQLPRSADVPPGLPDPRFTVQPASTHSTFSPDGRLVAWTCLMLNHQVWEVESGKLRCLLDWPEDKNAANGQVVRSGMSEGAPFPIPLFSPTGKRLVSALSDQRILIVDAEAGKIIRIVEKVPNAFLSFQKDGKTVACCSNRGPHLKLVHLNLETGQMETVIDREVPSKMSVVHAAFTADGSMLATIEKKLGAEIANPLALPGKCVVRLWDVQYGKPLGEVELANAPAKSRSKKAIRAARPAVPNQAPVPAVDDESYVACYDTYSNIACLFTPDAKRLAVTGATGYDTVDIWEVAWILLPADKRPAATTEKSVDAPAKREPKHAFRRWTSADEKFVVEARFQEFKNGKVSLKKRDGEVIHVAIEKLCSEDRDYVQALE